MVAREGLRRLLHQRLGHAHGVDRVDGLVGAQADDGPHAGGRCSLDDVVAAGDVGLDRLLAGRTRRTAPASAPPRGRRSRCRRRPGRRCRWSRTSPRKKRSRESEKRLRISSCLASSRTEDVDACHASVEEMTDHRGAEGAGASGDGDCGALNGCHVVDPSSCGCLLSRSRLSRLAKRFHSDSPAGASSPASVSQLVRLLLSEPQHFHPPGIRRQLRRDLPAARETRRSRQCERARNLSWASCPPRAP